jgi:ABC-type glutathione transport system ATPase component
MLIADIKKLSLIGGRELLSGINFELNENNIYTILGMNGSGKTTLIKSLTGLLNTRFYSVTGSVYFGNHDLFKLASNELQLIRKNKIKYVFQDAVNSFNHLKTFRYYFDKLAKDKEELDTLLGYFILPEYSYLNKLYPYEVSGGMAQRISFILALLSHPELLILDEPTSGIDPAISNLLLLKLKEFVSHEGNSALLVTHDIKFAMKISDKMAFLSGGRLSRFYLKEELFTATPTSLEDDLAEEPDHAANYELLKKFIESYKQLSQ